MRVYAAALGLMLIFAGGFVVYNWFERDLGGPDAYGVGCMVVAVPFFGVFALGSIALGAFAVYVKLPIRQVIAGLVPLATLLIAAIALLLGI